MVHQHWKNWIWLMIATMSMTMSISKADFTAKCPQPCECKWQSGNKAAICSNSNLKAVPDKLSNDIQNLELSNNPLRQLPPDAFKKAGLSNLKKLVLRECLIEVVHKSAFNSLGIMIELDLSKNRIKTLHTDLFKETEKLRWINLSNNLIEKLEDGLFRNLKFLQRVEVSNNRIVRVGIKTFVNLPRLQTLRLDGNNLTHMKSETLSSLNYLSSLDLHNNPWRCDCNLQTFRNWVINHNLYTPPTSCAGPHSVEDKLWNELDSSNFACRPTILEPLPDATVRSYDENVTLTCKVVGNPTPEVIWKFNSKVIESRSYGELRHFFTDNTVDLIRWVNVTIVHARYSDRGNYTCIAENPGGRDERNLTLVLAKFSGSGSGVGIDNDMLAIIFGCVCAAVIVSGVIVLMCYCLSCKKDNKRLFKPDTHSSNGEALIEGSVASEMEKNFISDVNPVTKPPRRYDAPPSVTSEATEMSELNRTLLDNDSVLASNEDNSQLQDLDSMPKMSQEALIFNRHTFEQQTYPPDLLSFPLRGSQISPATSGTSSSQERSKSAQTNPESPVKSPGYASNVGVFSSNFTRFQSPFTSQGCIPLIHPRGGYVTLPRKPRVPSWFPETSGSPTFTSINGVPCYDNLGVRFSADGSTYFTLNKSEMDLGPGNGQVVPAAFHIVHPVFDTPNEDRDPAPSPAPGTPHSSVPRTSISSPNIHNQLMALQAISASSIALQNAYARKLPSKYTISESNPLKEAFVQSQNENHIKYQPKEVIRITGGNVNNTVRRKIPPKAPANPRKKNPNELKEPFLESAREKATEV